MKTIAMVAIAAGLAHLGSCGVKRTANTEEPTDNLTEGIVINNAEVFANDANASATGANAAEASAPSNNAH